MSIANPGAIRWSWQSLTLALAVVGLSVLVYLHGAAVGIASALDGVGPTVVERVLAICSWLVLAAGAAFGWSIVARARWTRGAFVAWAVAVAIVLLALRLVPATIEGGRRRAIAAVLAVATVGWVLPPSRRGAV
jgi:hypothetical protein